MVASEALARKKKSIKRLRAEGVPVMDALPAIETAAEARIRTCEEVATRTMCLWVVAMRGEGLDKKSSVKLLKEYEITSSLTPKESAFVFSSRPSQHDRTQFTWRYECLWVLHWALGFVEELDRPDQICDVPGATAVLWERTREEFLEEARLRSPKLLLDEADLIYRYHWAVRNAGLKGEEPPAGLDPGVVLERHYALNWLIGYDEADWDNIRTDT